MTNLDLMRQRLEWRGGIHQEDRMIKDKWRTLQRVLKYSYQAATISLVQKYSDCLRTGSEEPEEPIGSVLRGLINPDRTKQDYDDKILSIDYSAGLEPGDVFRWRGTDTYWLIYLEELTEDAYFRGSIRRCKHKIGFKDESGKECWTWAAVRGPVETQIDSIQKNQVRIDNPNLSLNILMPRNEYTLAFRRYKEFLFAGRCWQVQAWDSISMRNIIEIAAKEHYIDRDTDDLEREMKDGLIIEPVDPTPASEIIGDTWIKPMLEEVYSVEEAGGKWSVEKNVPVCLVPLDEKSVKVKWKKTTHGQFDLTWTKDDKVYSKTIVVESLF